MTSEQILANKAQQSFTIDIQNLEQLSNRIDWNTYAHAAELLKDSRQVVVIGVGKSGVIAKKIAATFTSIGLPSVFLHPTDAMHGDIGIIDIHDSVILVSNSGSTEEILTILPFVKSRVKSIIGILGNSASQIGEHCNVILDASIQQESCILGIVPSSSLVAAITVSNALTAAVSHCVGLTKDKFAHSHPAGQLGRNLLLTVHSVMISGPENLPFVNDSMLLKNVIIEMSTKGLGCAIVINDIGELVGFITDGDVRRCLEVNENISSITAEQIMTKNPISINESALLGEALSLMEDREKKLGVLIVKNDERACSGIIRIHDIAGRVR